MLSWRCCRVVRTDGIISSNNSRINNTPASLLYQYLSYLSCLSPHLHISYPWNAFFVVCPSPARAMTPRVLRVLLPLIRAPVVSPKSWKLIEATLTFRLQIYTAIHHIDYIVYIYRLCARWVVLRYMLPGTRAVDSNTAIVEWPRCIEKGRKVRCWLGEQLLFFWGDLSCCINP